MSRSSFRMVSYSGPRAGGWLPRRRTGTSGLCSRWGRSRRSSRKSRKRIRQGIRRQVIQVSRRQEPPSDRSAAHRPFERANVNRRVRMMRPLGRAKRIVTHERLQEASRLAQSPCARAEFAPSRVRNPRSRVRFDAKPDHQGCAVHTNQHRGGTGSKKRERADEIHWLRHQLRVRVGASSARSQRFEKDFGQRFSFVARPARRSAKDAPWSP